MTHSYLFNSVDYFFPTHCPSFREVLCISAERLKLSCQIYCYMGTNQARPLHRQQTDFYSWYLENQIKDSQVGHSVCSFLGSSIAGPTSFQRPRWISTAFLLILFCSFARCSFSRRQLSRYFLPEIFFSFLKPGSNITSSLKQSSCSFLTTSS